MRNSLRAALIAAAVAALVTIPGLGSGTLWDNSETAYGEVAREILLTHDWVVMHLNALPWFVQPPLYFWIAAIFAKIFGITSFALRLPAALATIVMGALTAYGVARQAGIRAGLYAGVIVSTSLMQAIVGRLAIMDALLDLTVAFTIFWWFRSVQTGREKYVVLGWVSAALGFLAKGPVAPVISLLVIGIYFFWERRATHARLPSWKAWAAGILVFAAIVATWTVPLIAATGSHSIVRLIGHYTVGRYTGTIENQSGPVWYYLPVLILGFFPWIAFLPSAIAYGAGCLRSPMHEEKAHIEQIIRLAFVWIAVPLVFFSFAQTKLPNYIALETPALAVLVALYLDSALSRARSRSALISTASIPAVIFLLAVAIVIFSRENRLAGTLQRADVAANLLYFGGTIFVGCLVALFLMLIPARRAASPYVIGAAMICAVTFLAVLALPQAEQFKPIPHLARIIEQRRQPSDAIAIINVAGGNALLFYTQPRIYVLRDHDNARRVRCSADRTWLIGPREGYIPSDGSDAPKAVAGWGNDLLYLYTGHGDCAAARKTALTSSPWRRPLR